MYLNGTNSGCVNVNVNVKMRSGVHNREVAGTRRVSVSIRIQYDIGFISQPQLYTDKSRHKHTFGGGMLIAKSCLY